MEYITLFGACKLKNVPRMLFRPLIFHKICKSLGLIYLRCIHFALKFVNVVCNEPRSHGTRGRFDNIRGTVSLSLFKPPKQRNCVTRRPCHSDKTYSLRVFFSFVIHALFVHVSRCPLRVLTWNWIWAVQTFSLGCEFYAFLCVFLHNY